MALKRSKNDFYCSKLPAMRSESGLLSWFGLGGSNYDAKDQKPTPDQENFIKVNSTFY